MKGTFLKIVINSLLGLVFIWLWLSVINIEQSLNILKNADYRFAIGFVLFFFVSTILRSWRLKVFLEQFGFSLKELTFLNMLSQCLSFLIPVRAGEVSKGVYLISKSKMTLAQAFVAVFLDRFFDFWMMLLLVVLLTIFMPGVLNSQLQAAVIVAWVVFTAGGLFVYFSQKLAKTLSQKLPLAGFTGSIIDGFDLLRMSEVRWLKIALLTFIAAITDAIIWWSCLQAVGINLDIFKTQLGSALSMLTFLVPAAPGFVGSAEVSGIAVWNYLLGLPVELVSAATLYNHALTFVILPLTGLFSWYILKFDLKIIWKRLFNGD